MKEGLKKFRSLLITLGILLIWVALELLNYAIFGKGAVTTIIGIGITFVIGAYFFHAVKKAWKKRAG